VVGVPKSHACNIPQLQPFQASVNISKSTTEEQHSVATQHVVSNQAAQLHLASSSSREASPDIAIQDAKEGAKGGKKCKQHHQETTITTDDNGGISKQVGSSCVVCAMAATGSSKHQAWSPMDHIEKILEDTCSNHTYPIKHKLRDCSMMKSFMTLGSLP
jgi:hypothetical protein